MKIYLLAKLQLAKEHFWQIQHLNTANYFPSYGKENPELMFGKDAIITLL